VQRTDVALEDAGRAMQIIRAKAHPYGIDPARVGVVGFSAGAHLATMLALRAGRSDTRPDFMALGYPVVTMMKPYAHEASVEHLLGANASRAERAAWSCERFVTRDAPPAFVFAAADDPDVPVQNARMLYGNLQAKGVPAELHIFAHGGHSFGLGAPDSPPSAWPELFLAWGKSRGYFRG
jgi:acetyl esterase/lipase